MLIALVAACASVVAGCASGATTASDLGAPGNCKRYEEVKVQIYTGNMNSIQAWVMQEQGFLKQQCLKADLVPIASGPEATASSVQGAVNFVIIAPDTVYIPRAKGLDIRMVAGLNPTVFYSLVLPKDSPLVGKDLPTIMKGLKGKKVGVNKQGSTTYFLARANFAGAGLDPDSANWVALGPLAAHLAALDNGSVDAVELFGTGMDIAEESGYGVIVPAADLRKEGTGSGLVKQLTGAQLLWAAYGPWLEKNEEVAKRFKKANNEATKWIKDPANRDKVYGLVDKYAPLPETIEDRDAVSRRVTDAYVEQLSTQMSRKALKAWNAYGVENKAYDKEVDLDEAIWSGAEDVLVA